MGSTIFSLSVESAQTDSGRDGLPCETKLFQVRTATGKNKFLTSAGPQRGGLTTIKRFIPKLLYSYKEWTCRPTATTHAIQESRMMIRDAPNRSMLAGTFGVEVLNATSIAPFHYNLCPMSKARYHCRNAAGFTRESDERNYCRGGAGQNCRHYQIPNMVRYAYGVDGYRV